MQKKIATCHCRQSFQKCIKTGFPFMFEGAIFNGDLFACSRCNAFNIFGINKNCLDPRPDYKTFGSFEGLLEFDSEPFGQTYEGIITINENLIQHLEKWDPFVLSWPELGAVEPKVE